MRASFELAVLHGRIYDRLLMAHVAAVTVIYGSWLALAVLLAARALTWLRAPRTPTVRRDTRAFVGIVIQAIAFVPVWSHTTRYPSVTSGMAMASIGLMVLTVPLLVWSVVALGAQWSIQARLKADHKLIVTGPYRLVRHPIYTSLLGFMVAAGLLFTTPMMLAAAVVFYVVGTVFRMQAEDGLLRGTFGAEFDAYVARTPALMPGLR